MVTVMFCGGRIDRHPANGIAGRRSYLSGKLAAMRSMFGDGQGGASGRATAILPAAVSKAHRCRKVPRFRALGSYRGLSAPHLDVDQGVVKSNDYRAQGAFCLIWWAGAFSDAERWVVTRLLWLLASVGAFSMPLSAAAQNSSPGYAYGPGMMAGWGWSAMIFGPLFMIFILAAGIAVIVLLVRWLGGPPHWGPPHHSPRNSSALDILKERYARGEIDKQEFEERRRVLGE